MSDDDDSRRLYQEAYEDGCRRCDADCSNSSGRWKRGWTNCWHSR